MITSFGKTSPRKPTSIAEADFAEPNSKFNAAFKLIPGLILISSTPSKKLAEPITLLKVWIFIKIQQMLIRG